MGITNPKLMYLLRGSVSNLRQYFQVYSRKRIGRNNKAARYRLQATYNISKLLYQVTIDGRSFILFEPSEDLYLLIH